MKTDLSKAIPASEIKLHFGNALNRCVYGKEVVHIKKHGQVVAVMVNYEDWQNKNKASAKKNIKENPLYERFLQIRKNIADHQKKSKGRDNKSAVELVRESRDERDHELTQRWEGIKK